MHRTLFLTKLPRSIHPISICKTDSSTLKHIQQKPSIRNCSPPHLAIDTYFRRFSMAGTLTSRVVVSRLQIVAQGMRQKRPLH